MAYGDFRDISRKTASDKLLRDKVFNIAENLKYDGSQRGLAPMVDINFLIKNLLELIFPLPTYGQKLQLRQINLHVMLLKLKLCQNKN